MNILVVEDDRKLGRFIEKGLEEAAYRVTLAGSGAAATDALYDGEYELIILDLGLPDGSGLELLRKWRKSRVSTPILILSARGSLEDRISGLNLGADDYLGKPFSFDELLARARSLTRRHAGQRSTVLEYGGIRMDLLSREVGWQGEPLVLTQREFALLEYFLQNPNRVLTRTQISEKIWDCHFDMGTNLIDVYVRRLRAKLGGENSPINTVRGVGYVLK